MAAASDSSDEDEVSSVRANSGNAAVRESIRQQLALAAAVDDAAATAVAHGRRDSNHLLELCFLNDVFSEGGCGGDNDNDASKPRPKLTLDELTARYIERNNISKKSNHVIVPLSPKSEEETSYLDEPQQESRSLSDAEAFTAYLAEIQAEARQKLKTAKYEAKAAADSEEESSALSRDQSCFFKDPCIPSPKPKVYQYYIHR